MFNRQRTLELLGYDIDVSRRRRTKVEIANAPQVDKKGQLRVIDNCPQCGIERNIKLKQSLKNKLCSKCFHNQDYVLAAKRSQKRNLTEETRQKMVDNHWLNNGGTSPFKGKSHTPETKQHIVEFAQKQQQQLRETLGEEEYKIRMSMAAQRIPRDQFAGFTSPENTRIRQSDDGKAWTREILQKANYTCDRCSHKGGQLAAHHLNAFASYPEERFTVDNGVCMCKDCHDLFHQRYGKGDNTKDQYAHFRAQLKPVLYMIIGVAAAGKSWVCNQLTEQFHYLPYDKTPREHTLYRLKELSKDTSKPLLFDPTFKISTFIKHHNDLFDIRLIAINESAEVIRTRVEARGGEFTDHMLHRIGEIQKRFAKYGANGFMGTSSEVLAYLRSITAPK